MKAVFQNSTERKKFLKAYLLTLLAFAVPSSIQGFLVVGDITPKFFIMPLIVANIFGILLGWNSVLRYRLQEASKAKNRLIRNISHEISNPLNVIKGFSGLLADKAEISEENKQFIDHIKVSGEHIINIIDDLLDIAHIETGKVKIHLVNLELGSIISSLLPLLSQQLESRKMQLDTSQVEKDLFVIADKTRLTQILVNLVTNAMKYGPDDSIIYIKAHRVGASARICVIDTGPGIAKELLPELFIPFNRIGAENTEVKGTGLGLALCKNLVEAQRGRIGVNSQVQQGCEFWFELPLGR
jgi:signal transduction histidine kinase